MKKSFILVLIGAMLLSLLCCRTDSKTDTDSEPTIKFKRTTNDVIVTIIADADKLNPLLATSGYANSVHDYLFQFLEYLHPETGALVPQLVKTKPVIEDRIVDGKEQGVAFTFELLENATWPNGTPVLAEDFVFTLKALFNPKVPAEQYRGFLSSVESVEVDAENPRRFTVNTREKYFLNEASITAGVPVMPRYHYDPKGLMKDFDLNDLLDPKKAASLAKKDARLQEFADFFTTADLSQNPVGSGAYELEEWETGQRIVLKRKENWWGKKYEGTSPFYNAKVEAITYKIIPDNTAATTALKAEEVDVKASIDPVNFGELKNSVFAKERYNLYQMPNLVYYFMYLNNKDIRLKDKRVRQAIAHVVHVDEIIETIYEGSQRVNGPAHPTRSYYRKDLPNIPFNIEKAKQLLADAGWTDTNDNGIADKEIDGELVEMDLELLIAAGRQTNEDLAAIFSKESIKAGIKITPIAKDSKLLFGEVKARNYQISIAGARNAPIAWDPKQRFHSESDAPGGFNYMGFRNETADNLIDEIRVTLDEGKRNKLYRELLDLIYEEQPMIFMFTTTNNMAIHKRFETEPSGLRPGFFPNSFVLKKKEMEN